jgi:dienelactone hydrolase
VPLLVLLASTLLVLGLSHPGRVAFKTLLLLPDMFPTSPVRPLTWFTPEPRREEYNYDFSVGRVESDVYFPADGDRHGALILFLGAVGYPRREPALVRLADGLSRAGAVVMIPESSNLQQGDILPRETDGLIEAARYLREREEVDSARVGILGFSVGGSLALLAAQDDLGREQIAFVNAFGAYYDARSLLRAVVTRQFTVDGRVVAWEPSELTVWVLSRQLILNLPDAQDRDILTRAILEQDPAAWSELGQLSPDGLVVQELLGQPSPERAEALLAALPSSIQQRLAEISPSRAMERLKAAIFLMHDREDVYIPFVESRRIAAAAPAGTVRLSSEFDLFSHVMPDRPLEGPRFVLEVFKLYVHAWLFCQEFL